MDVKQDLVNELPRLRRYALALLGDPAAADDLVQDCLARALSRLHLFRPGTDLRAWLFTIMHNVFVNAARRHPPAAVPLDAVTDGPAAAPEQDGRAALRDVSRALAQLPAEQRQVVLLIGLEEMSYRQASDVLGIPVGTVMSRLARGRQRLRRAMEGETPAALRRVK